jgi:hypothetical protein
VHGSPSDYYSAVLLAITLCYNYQENPIETITRGTEMAKAHIETADGVKVKLEGTPAEISAVLKEVEAKSSGEAARKARTKRKGGKVTKTSLLEDLRNEGFFKKAKKLSEVKKRLADLGHSYPLTALSGPMRKEVRNKRLKRTKENGKYVYGE